MSRDSFFVAKEEETETALLSGIIICLCSLDISKTCNPINGPMVEVNYNLHHSFV